MEQQDTIEAAEVSMIEPEVVVQIRTLSGLKWGSLRISKELGISKKAVKRYLRGAVAGAQVRPKARRLDAAGEKLAQELFEGAAEGNAVVVKDMLAEHGYAASERTVQRAVADARRARRAADVATARFETKPGEQLQIDFGEKRVSVGGHDVVVHLMAAVLGYSRRIFVKAFLCERAEDWREGLADAFRHFGGVTRVVLVDNTRCLVKGRDVESKTIVLHPGLVELCRNFGCAVKACAPYRARTKGKIENGVKFVKRNALAGRKFASFAGLEAHLSSWVERVDRRIHGTTHDVPLARFEAERAALLPLPSSSVLVRNRRLRRKVANDAYVDVNTVRYSVPYALVGRHVDVEEAEERMRIFVGAKLVADHRRSKEPHSLVTDPAHHDGLWRLATEAPTANTCLKDMGRTLDVYAAAIGGGP